VVSFAFAARPKSLAAEVSVVSGMGRNLDGTMWHWAELRS
jgi:hypothetical protein